MFKTLEDGVRTYRLELIAYLIWLEKTTKSYNGNDNHFCWGSSDYNRANTWNAKLEGMEKALGLTKEEDKVLLSEAKAVIEKLRKTEVASK